MSHVLSLWRLIKPKNNRRDYQQLHSELLLHDQSLLCKVLQESFQMLPKYVRIATFPVQLVQDTWLQRTHFNNACVMMQMHDQYIGHV